MQLSVTVLFVYIVINVKTNGQKFHLIQQRIKNFLAPQLLMLQPSKGVQHRDIRIRPMTSQMCLM